MQKLLSDIDYIIKTTECLNIRIDALDKSVDDSKKSIAALKQKQMLIISCREKYKLAVDNTYTVKIRELEDLLNTVIKSIFFDEDYSIKIDLSDKNNKSIYWYLIDNTKDCEVSLNRGVGKGVKTVVSTIIYIYYLLKFNKDYMFVDEIFHNLSADYIQNFMGFIKDICREKDFTVVSISHDERLTCYADILVQVSNGLIKQHEVNN